MATAAKKRGVLYSIMGRPPNKKLLDGFSDHLIEAILSMRKEHSGWGAKTIYYELQNDKRFCNLKIPSIRSIGYLLKNKGLVKRYERHVLLPDSQVNPASKPHQLWQLDAQGSVVLDSIGPIAMINIKDVCSRIYCMAFPNKKPSKFGNSKRADYQCALRLAFMEYGLPEQIQTDHENVFYDNKGKSPFPTVLHLWLLGLGLRQVFSRVHQPTDQAKVERMHQIIDKQAIQGVKHQDWQSLFDLCQQRRKFLNQIFPCRTLADQSPYQAFANARHSGKYYQPQQEEQMIDLNRIYDFLAKGKWYRKTSTLRSTTLGGQVYYLKGAKPNTQVQISFDRETLNLNFHDDKELLIQTMPIKGICKKKLMGELFWKMSNVQLELPFCWDTQKISTTFLHNT